MVRGRRLGHGVPRDGFKRGRGVEELFHAGRYAAREGIGRVRASDREEVGSPRTGIHEGQVLGYHFGIATILH